MKAPEEAQMKRGRSSSTPGVGAGPQSGRRLSSRAGWFLAALAVFILSTFFAFTQVPRPDVYRSHFEAF